jgi:hypothetical protein
MQTPAFQKYVFNGGATAFHGSVRKPYFQDLGKHLEISTYAGGPVNIRCTNGRFAFDGYMSYESATTSIVTRENDHFVECEVFAQVTGLKIAGRLSIGEVTSRLRSVYDKRGYPGRMFARISPAGSTIKDFLVIGQDSVVPDLPKAFTLSDAEANEALYGQVQNDDAIAPDARLVPASVPVPDFGTIYFAEWASAAQEQGEQHLTMVRLALGSDVGADCDVGCTYTDGSGWPPRP